MDVGTYWPIQFTFTVKLWACVHTFRHSPPRANQGAELLFITVAINLGTGLEVN